MKITIYDSRDPWFQDSDAGGWRVRVSDGEYGYERHVTEKMLDLRQPPGVPSNVGPIRKSVAFAAESFAPLAEKHPGIVAALADLLGLA